MPQLQFKETCTKLWILLSLILSTHMECHGITQKQDVLSNQSHRFRKYSSCSFSFQLSSEIKNTNPTALIIPTRHLFPQHIRFRLEFLNVLGSCKKIQVQKGNKYGLDKTICRKSKQPTKPVGVSAMGWAGHTRLPECFCNQLMMWQPICTRLTAGSAAIAAWGQRTQTQVWVQVCPALAPQQLGGRLL